MGNDGNFLPTRDCLVKEKPKEVICDHQLKAKVKARLCSLTKSRLQKPVVVCKLGYLYNYESVVKFLMEKQMPKEFAHLQRIKDLKEVNLYINDDEKSEYQFMCPLSKIEYNGLNRFFINWVCGCMFSEKLVENVKKGEGQYCPVCNIPCQKTDFISLNMSEKQIEAIQQQIVDERKQKKTRQAEKQRLQEGEKPKKKVKKAEEIIQLPTSSIMQKIAENESADFKYQTDVVKKLFHKSEKEDVGFFRNVRHGIR